MNAANSLSQGEGNGKPRVSLLHLEKYLLNELSPEERLDVESQAAQDGAVGEYLARMKTEVSPLTWSKVRMQAQERRGVEVSDFFSAAMRRLSSLFSGPARPLLAWGGVMALLLVLVPVSLHRGGGLRAKGSGQAEVSLQVDGAAVAPGREAHVQSGGILTFSYRSVFPLFAQIWYLEDGGAPSAFEGKGDVSLSWPASSSWTLAQQRIRLEGDWKAQRVIVVTSRNPLSRDEGLKLLSGASKPGKGERMFSFNLLQP
jgi:hypothetical protein